MFGAFWGPSADFSFFPLHNNRSPVVANAVDTLLFKEKQKLMEPCGNTVDKTLVVARSFLGMPYVHGCLDGNLHEQLTINLRQLDCWTFVENSIAIALTGDGDFNEYEEQLQRLRYWGGYIDGYGSRIHYFTGWLLQAEKYGLLEDVTAALGGVPYDKKVGYISARSQKYPKIADPKALRDIQHAEKRINAHKWHFIPKQKIAAMEHLIQEGDLVCLTSAKSDLDIAHQGFAVKKDGRIHLMHASSLAGKVIIARLPLAEYVASQRGQSGIMVSRLK